jgi:hypothetical protein
MVNDRADVTVGYEKTGRYDRIINELCHFYKVSLIKTGLMFHKYHLLNQLQVFMRSFNIPLRIPFVHFEKG